MAPRTPRRDQWRKTKKGTWTRSLGDRGYRVRLFENRRGGHYYSDIRRPDASRYRESLGTTDRSEADRKGRDHLARLLSGGSALRPGGDRQMIVTLGALCDRFLTECAAFLDNAVHSQADTRSRLRILQAGFGASRDASTLTRNDVQQYEARRKIGGIRVGDKVTGRVRQRSVQADVKLLKQVLQWATTVVRPDGGRLLSVNPLDGVGVKGEPDVQRPVASYDRFEATRLGMHQLQAAPREAALLATSAGGRHQNETRYRSWVRAELGLVLLEATGRRRGSIVKLRWEDVDFLRRQITWRPENDKKRKTWIVSYPEALFNTLTEFRDSLNATSGFLFPHRDDAARHALPEWLSNKVLEAEEAAGLTKLRGGVSHPYRRKWRSERTHHPLKAVATAGGWTDVQTMIRSYDVPDDAAVLAVTSEPHKRREPSVIGRQSDKLVTNSAEHREASAA